LLSVLVGGIAKAGPLGHHPRYRIADDRGRSHRDEVSPMEECRFMKLTRYPGNPILKPIADHPWESRTVFNCGVTQLNDKVILIYRAQGEDSDISHLGYAESGNGFRFVRNRAPVFSPSTPEEVKGVEDPRITFLEGRYQMLYTAWSEGAIQVARASTSDFHTWERHGIVFPGPDNKDAALFPRKIGGRYCAFHRIPRSIWIAWSDDLVTWGDYQKILDPRPNTIEPLKLGAGGPPIETPYGWLVIYHGVDHDLVYRLGVVLLDLEDPTKIVNWPSTPILEPEEPWELEGDVPNVVFTCGTAEIGDQYFIYYGGADKVIAVATCNKAELLEFARFGA
jgi:predicted GH43/DUF377 family glycosyl hydrolase